MTIELHDEPDFTIVDRACPHGFGRKGAYDAVCWAVGKTEEEVRAELDASIARVGKGYLTNEVGNATDGWARVDALTLIHKEMTRTW
jgi:hypothetical protein